MSIDAEVIKLRAVRQLHTVTAWGWKWAWGEHCIFSGRQTGQFLCIMMCGCHWLLRKRCNWFARTIIQAGRE